MPYSVSPAGPSAGPSQKDVFIDPFDDLPAPLPAPTAVAQASASTTAVSPMASQAPAPRRGLFLGFGGASELVLKPSDAPATAAALLDAVDALADFASRLRIPGSASKPTRPGGDRGFHICVTVESAPDREGPPTIRRAFLKTDLETFAQVARDAGAPLRRDAWFERYREYRRESEPCPLTPEALGSRAVERARAGETVQVDVDHCEPVVRLPEPPPKEVPYRDPKDLMLSAFSTTHFAVSYDVQTRPHVIITAKCGRHKGVDLPIRGSYYDLPPELRRELFEAVEAVVRGFAGRCGARHMDVQIHLGGWRTLGQFHLHVIVEPEAYVRSFQAIAGIMKLEEYYPIGAGKAGTKPWRRGFERKLCDGRAKVDEYLKSDWRVLERMWNHGC